MLCPYNYRMIPINKPWLGEEEKQEILNILEENVLTSPAI